MAIKKKVEIDSVISKGGQVSSDKHLQPSWGTLCLRIRNDMLDSVNQKLSDRVGMSRNAWILEAIREKLHQDCLREEDE